MAYLDYLEKNAIEKLANMSGKCQICRIYLNKCPQVRKIIFLDENQFEVELKVCNACGLAQKNFIRGKNTLNFSQDNFTEFQEKRQSYLQKIK